MRAETAWGAGFDSRSDASGPANPSFVFRFEIETVPWIPSH